MYTSLLFKFALEKGVLAIHLMEVPPFCHYKCNHGLNSCHLCHWGKGIFIVDTLRLGIAFCYESRLVAVGGAIGIILHLVYPSTTDCLLVRRVGDEIPYLILRESLHLLVHCFDLS